jgi:chromate transport protein ChrA
MEEEKTETRRSETREGTVLRTERILGCLPPILILVSMTLVATKAPWWLGLLLGLAAAILWILAAADVHTFRKRLFIALTVTFGLLATIKYVPAVLKGVFVLLSLLCTAAAVRAELEGKRSGQRKS